MSGPDQLQQLTYKFRESLKEWLDEGNNRKIVVIDGQDIPLLTASISEVINYALEFTQMWVQCCEESKKEFAKIWFIDCRGLYISRQPQDIFLKESLKKLAPAKFNDSIISFGILFAHTVFLGDVEFRNVEFRYDCHFNESIFYGEVIFDNASFSRETFFSGCDFKFNKAASFHAATFSRRVDFSNAHFNRAPILTESKLPQGSTFDGVSFNQRTNELKQHDLRQEFIAFRTLRQITGTYKGQQDEAIFFAFEQRCYRKAFLALRLVWKKESYKTDLQGNQGLGDLLIWDTWKSIKGWRFCCKPVDWLISWFYDFLSEYGSDPSRAVFWLFFINIISGVFMRTQKPKFYQPSHL